MLGKEVRDLMEAYQQVYTPQELTEEQVWEGVENWVHSLLEEGYDLSDYTWEEMYESYLNEALLDDVKTDMRNSAAQKTVNKALSGGLTAAAKKPSPNMKSVNDSQFVKDVKNDIRNDAAQKTVNKALSGGPKIVAPKIVDPKTTPRPVATTTPTSTDPKTTPRPAATTTPTSTAPKTTSTPTATTTPKPAAMTPMQQFAKANPRLAAAQAEKDRIRGTSQSDNPLMKDMKDKMPMTPSVQSPTLKKDLGGGSGNQSLLDNPNASKAATPKKTPITSSFDIFDIVKGHLLDEGYADTEEGAEVIMVNMSQGWRESILESCGVELIDESQHARENPEEYERSKEAKEGRKERSMKSAEFKAFMAKQMSGNKKTKQ